MLTEARASRGRCANPRTGRSSPPCLEAPYCGPRSARPSRLGRLRRNSASPPGRPPTCRVEPFRHNRRRCNIPDNLRRHSNIRPSSIRVRRKVGRRQAPRARRAESNRNLCRLRPEPRSLALRRIGTSQHRQTRRSRSRMTRRRGHKITVSQRPTMDDTTITETTTQKIENARAVFAGLDKSTGRTISFDAAIGETVQFGALQVTARACYTRPPTEPTNTDAFVEVDEVTLQGEIRRLFTGWMFASSPSLDAVEHPVYVSWPTSWCEPR